MITFKSKGDFSKLDNWFQKNLAKVNLSILDKYGKKGVLALAEATPFDSGETAISWYYEIERKDDNTITINFCNSHIVNYVPIAIILQYGHATRNGGWVEGTDYINPAIQPIFNELCKKAWKEVIR